MMRQPAREDSGAGLSDSSFQPSMFDSGAGSLLKVVRDV